MKDLQTRRLERAARKYPDAPNPEAALAHAEAASRFDEFALGGIGMVRPIVGKLKP